MSDDQIYQSMLLGKARNLARERNDYANSLRQANANMDDANAIIMDKHFKILALRNEVDLLNVRLLVAKSDLNVAKSDLNVANADLNVANVYLNIANADLNIANADLDAQKRLVENTVVQRDNFYAQYVQQMADAQGNKAMYTAMKSFHPDSLVQGDSGSLYKDGSIKSHARILYEVEFDRIINLTSIGRPENFRAD